MSVSLILFSNLSNLPRRARLTAAGTRRQSAPLSGGRSCPPPPFPPCSPHGSPPSQPDGLLSRSRDGDLNAPLLHSPAQSAAGGSASLQRHALDVTGSDRTCSLTRRVVAWSWRPGPGQRVAGLPLLLSADCGRERSLQGPATPPAPRSAVGPGLGTRIREQVRSGTGTWMCVSPRKGQRESGRRNGADGATGA